MLRMLTAMLLALTLFAAPVFADAEGGAQSGGAPQAETPADQSQSAGGSQEAGAAQDQPQPQEAPAPVSHIIKKGRYYYYKSPSTGKIRKKKGFVTDCGKRYYIKKGGKIVTGKTFKIKKKQYRAYKNGVIATGIYTWKKKLNYSDAKGVWIKKASLVNWNGSSYYVQKGGTVLKGDAFSFKNIPYVAGAEGRVTQLAIPDTASYNTVVAVAKDQVGIMTGKTYWRWYFKTRFINTDRTPWCGAFVAWVYNAAGQYDKVSAARSFGNLGYVPSYSRYANSAGKWVANAAALPGDIIIFGRNRHVGLVEGVADGYIFTIEGNAGPTAVFGSKKPGAVVRNVYRLNNSKINGVIRVL